MNYVKVNSTILNQFLDACEKGDLESFDAMIKSGIDPNSEDFFTRERAIHVAARNGNRDIVVRLLNDKRVMTDVADGAWLFPADLARINGDFEMAALLEASSERLALPEPELQNPRKPNGRDVRNGPRN